MVNSSHHVVPTCKIMVLGFFRIIGIRLCSISVTVAPRKLHTLTGLSFLSILPSIMPLMMESPTMTVVSLG